MPSEGPFLDLEMMGEVWNGASCGRLSVVGGAGVGGNERPKSNPVLCRATVLIYLQGITAKNFYYSYVKKHRSRWELVGRLSRAAPK